MSHRDETSELTQRLRAFVTRRLGNHHDVEDIVQDVLLKLHERPPGDGLSDQRRAAWAFRVARNAIIDLHRRHGRRSDVPVEDTFAAPAPADPPAAASLACLPRMLDRLAPDYRRALRLSDVHGLSSAEVAGHLGLSISGAKSRVQRARRQVRGMLLDCCDLEFDARGELLDFQPTSRAREYCVQPCGGD